MNLINSILTNELVLAIGQTILNSLWQGAAIGILCWLMFGLVNKENTQVRYWISAGGILSILLVAVITFMNVYSSNSIPIGENPLGGAGLLFINRVSWTLPYVCGLWLMGTTFFSIRLLGGLLYIQRIKSQRTPIISQELNNLIKRISKNLQLNKVVELAESAKVSVPTIIGHLKPILLFPVGALAGLPVNQIEAIISHEMAHLKRYDYLINLIISIVEVLFFFNPVIWWLSAGIRADREILCDDLALGVTRDPANYARALSSVQEIAQGSLRLAPAFSGKKGQLLHRIQRIYNSTSTTKSKTNFSSSLTVLLILASFVVLFSSSIQATKTTETETESIEFASEVDPAVPTAVTAIEKVEEIDPVEIEVEEIEIEEIEVVRSVEEEIEIDEIEDLEMEVEINMDEVEDSKVGLNYQLKKKVYDQEYDDDYSLINDVYHKILQ